MGTKNWLGSIKKTGNIVYRLLILCDPICMAWSTCVQGTRLCSWQLNFLWDMTYFYWGLSLRNEWVRKPKHWTNWYLPHGLACWISTKSWHDLVNWKIEQLGAYYMYYPVGSSCILSGHVCLWLTQSGLGGSEWYNRITYRCCCIVGCLHVGLPFLLNVVFRLYGFAIICYCELENLIARSQW